MKNEELTMNSEEYKCSSFNVGAGDFVSAQENTNEQNANAVGACIARLPKDKSNANGITLISLIITIIIMLILVGVVLTLSIGEHSIFKTSQIAVEEHKKARDKRRN